MLTKFTLGAAASLAALVALPGAASADLVWIGMGADGPIWGAPGWEVNALYIAGYLALLISGAGAFSIDRLFTRRLHAERSTWDAGSTPRSTTAPTR